MASRRSNKGGGSHAFSVSVDGIKELIGAFDRLRTTEQLKSYRKAASKSVRKVRRTMKSLAPKGDGLNRDGEKRPHLRDNLAFNVKTLGRGDSRFVSGIVGADYKRGRELEIPDIHLVSNPTKPHVIKVSGKGVLSDVNSAGNETNATVFGTKVSHPGTPGNGFMQEAAKANEHAIKNDYVAAIRDAVKNSGLK